MLCDDLQCYDADNIPSGKTPIAVVFDSANRLAIELDMAPTKIVWGPSGTDSDIVNYETSSDALAATVSGKENTTLAYSGSRGYSSSTAIGYCYLLTTGNQGEGTWFLPSLGELQTLGDNVQIVNEALAKLTDAAEIAGYAHWSSSEQNSTTAYSMTPSTHSIYSTGKDEYQNVYTRCAIQY